MNRHLVITTALFALGLGLAGCNKSETTAGNQTPSSESADTAASTMPSNWIATDACSILDKSAVASALARDVKSADLGLVSEPGRTTAATSECVYMDSDDKRLASLTARWSPIHDNTQAAIDGARNVTASVAKAFSPSPIVDIQGMGKAAFFAEGINSLTVYIDDARMITVTVNAPPEGVAGREIATILAKKAGA